jgi:hypothetical protein
MAEDRLAVLDTVRKAIAEGDPDFLREGVRGRKVIRRALGARSPAHRFATRSEAMSRASFRAQIEVARMDAHTILTGESVRLDQCPNGPTTKGSAFTTSRRRRSS